jgi:hypothetical protein
LEACMVLRVMTCEVSSSRLRTMETTMGKDTTCKVAYSRKTATTKALSTELPLSSWEAALHNRNSRTGPCLDSDMHAFITEPHSYSWLHATRPCVFELIQTKDHLHALLRKSRTY